MNKKHFVALLLFSICSVYAAPKINKKEYAQLVQDCQTIASRIRQQQNFEIIRQNALKNHQQTMAGIAERFGNKNPQQGFYGSTSQLENSLEILRIDHERGVTALIIQAISIYLQSVGTPAAEQLARDLVKARFQNMGLL